MSQRRGDQLARSDLPEADQQRLQPASPFNALKPLLIRAWESPKGKTVIGLWILGLLFMYLAPAPMPISPETMDQYDTMIQNADNLDKFGDTLAELHRAQAHMYDAQVWFWRWRSPHREIVLERQEQVAKVQAKVDEINAKRLEMQRQANNLVGIWSQYGLAEARDRFWSAFDAGKVFATRQTFWQMLFSLSNRDNLVGTLLEWILIAVMNFTMGLIGSLFYYVFSLGSLLWSFNPNPVSGLLFYAVALLSATSVVATYLLGVFGLGTGTAYVIHKVAVQRLQIQYEERRRAAAALGRGGDRFGGNEHED